MLPECTEEMETCITNLEKKVEEKVNLGAYFIKEEPADACDLELEHCAKMTGDPVNQQATCELKFSE